MGFGGATPAGGEPGTGEGLRRIINLLSDGEGANEVTGNPWRG